MKNIGLVFISILLLLVGCNNNSSNEPVKEEKKTDDFNLVIESDKNIYQKEDDIQISSYFEYVGEKDIELNPKPSITIVVRNYENGDVVEQIDFNEVKTTMKEKEKISQTLGGINLEKGKYDAFVKVSPFSVGSNQFSLSAVPIIFEVK